MCSVYCFLSKSQRGMRYLLNKAAKDAGKEEGKWQAHHIGNHFLNSVKVRCIFRVANSSNKSINKTLQMMNNMSNIIKR